LRAASPSNLSKILFLDLSLLGICRKWRRSSQAFAICLRQVVTLSEPTNEKAPYYHTSQVIVPNKVLL